MPGYIFAKGREPIYSDIKTNKKSKASHQLFNDPKSREVLETRGMERDEYMKYLRNKNMQYRGYIPTNFDSIKLLGSPNDDAYLDSFMTMPRKHRRMSVCDDSDILKQQSHSMVKSASAATLSRVRPSKGANLPPSVHSSSSLAMLTSLRSSTSEDSLYESVEMIHYLKTKKILDRQQKTRSLQKTGHSLFDHLREEQALKVPTTTLQRRRASEHDRPQRLQPSRSGQFYQTSTGSSPTHSNTSSSGDEYETFSRNHSRQTAKYIPKETEVTDRRHQKVRAVPSVPSVGSESDDDWAIPRPLFMKQLLSEKKNKTPKVTIFTPPCDESDSSIKSSGAR